MPALKLAIYSLMVLAPGRNHYWISQRGVINETKSDYAWIISGVPKESCWVLSCFCYAQMILVKIFH